LDIDRAGGALAGFFDPNVAVFRFGARLSSAPIARSISS
jgi:hypothetical protein